MENSEERKNMNKKTVEMEDRRAKLSTYGYLQCLIIFMRMLSH